MEYIFLVKWVVLYFLYEGDTQFLSYGKRFRLLSKIQLNVSVYGLLLLGFYTVLSNGSIGNYFKAGAVVLVMEFAYRWFALGYTKHVGGKVDEIRRQHTTFYLTLGWTLPYALLLVYSTL